MTGRGRTRRAVWAAVIAALGFLGLATLVATGITQSLDVAAREFFRPNHEWTRAQIRADVVVEGLRPRAVAALMALAGICSSLQRRSWLPVVQAAAIGLVGGLIALVAKLALGRHDPSGEMSALGGSFPSGHVLSVLVCLGGAVLVATSRSRWWQWTLVVTAAGAMAYGLLIQSAHWLTDVAGGALLGLSVLAAAMALTPRGSRSPRRDVSRRHSTRACD